MKYLILIVVFLSSCVKKTDSDPLFSLKSRNKRFNGNWEVMRYYYYDGKKSGKGGSGDPAKYYYSIKKSGDWLICDSQFNTIVQLGYWNWVISDTKKQSETSFVLGYQRTSTPGGHFHILERLSYTQIRTREYFDVSDEKRYMVYEWKRRE